MDNKYHITSDGTIFEIQDDGTYKNLGKVNEAGRVNPYDNGKTDMTRPQQKESYQPLYPKGHGSMGFSDAIRVCLKEKFASFEGRATRAEYWYFALFCVLIVIGAAFAGGLLGAVLSGGDGNVIMGFLATFYAIICIGLICPSISVLVRRLHDTGRSGWWYWLCLLPYLGGFVIFIFTLLSSEEHDNKYGRYIIY